MAELPRIDVLGLGAVAIDDILHVEHYPEADTKTHVRKRDRRFGGQTGTALATASRFGAHAAFAGLLGHDIQSNLAAEGLDREGVDILWLKREVGVEPIQSTIIVGDSGRTRTIFADTRKFRGADRNWPPDEVIRSARVLFVDHWGVDGMIRAARIAHEAGIPIVADFERISSPRFGELLELADHLIVSCGFATQLTGCADPAEAALHLATGSHHVVIVTGGSRGSWALERGVNRIYHTPAYAVILRDTTGCGDVFHGAYAALLAFGEPLSERLALATAAAGLRAENSIIPDRRASQALRDRS